MCPTRRVYPIMPEVLPSTSTLDTIPMSVSVMVPKSCSQPMAVLMQIVHASSATRSKQATFATAFSFATASPGAAPGAPSKTISTSSSNHNKNKERRDIPSSLRPPVQRTKPFSFLLPRSSLVPPSSFLARSSFLAQALAQSAAPGSGAKVQSPATLLWGLTPVEHSTLLLGLTPECTRLRLISRTIS